MSKVQRPRGIPWPRLLLPLYFLSLESFTPLSLDPPLLTSSFFSQAGSSPLAAIPLPLLLSLSSFPPPFTMRLSITSSLVAPGTRKAGGASAKPRAAGPEPKERLVESSDLSKREGEGGRVREPVRAVERFPKGRKTVTPMGKPSQSIGGGNEVSVNQAMNRAFPRSPKRESLKQYGIEDD